jgi:hypothetical protein
MMLKHTNGSEVLIGTRFTKERFLHPGFPRSETPLILSTSIGMQSQLRHPACLQRNNRNISQTFDELQMNY